MHLVQDQLILSASDLNNYLACEHLTTLDLARARGELDAKPERGADAELLGRKGDEHEKRYLELLKAEGREVVAIEQGDKSYEALLAAVARTEEAMRAGAEVIYQATFLRDGLRGHADFLFRVDRPSDLGDFSYEVADTKLARRPKPYFVIQLCFYSELVAAVQGTDPEQIHVVLGDGTKHSFRLAEFSAYFRRVRDGFLVALSDGLPDTYPEPVGYCEICRWRSHCDKQRIADDHLSLVAGINRRQRDLLREAGIGTLEALGSGHDFFVPGMNTDVLNRLRDQAALQLGARRTGKHEYVLREPEVGRGFARLPRPSPGDVFFDMEGDPFFASGSLGADGDDDPFAAAGLEYLFGLVTVDDDRPEFRAIWGRDRAEEKAALEEFIDFVTERRRRYPDLHVYHYAHYEVTALKRLAGAHGTREEELDQLLRDQVFVDLYKVVKEAMLISQPSYSIKKVEAFYMDERETAVTDGGDSVIMFERWLEEGDDAILDEIAAYNRDDCVSTLKLRDWLLERRKEAIAEYAGSGLEAAEFPWFEPEAQERSDTATDFLAANEELMERLLEGVPEEPAERDPEQGVRALMASLLEYHRREARPVWWAFYERLDAEPEELLEDSEAIAMLIVDERAEPRPEKQSTVHRLSFPEQETKLGPGSAVRDPADGESPGSVVAMDADEGWLELKRGPSKEGRPLPRALIPAGPIPTPEQQAALRRLAAAVIADGGSSYQAAAGILRRESPRLADRPAGAAIDHEGMELEELKGIVASLDRSHLFIQGPPGSGKTYTGARLIVDLIARGKRVGVTATSHQAIHNLLAEVEEVAVEQGFSFRGAKKCNRGDRPSEFASRHGLIESVPENVELNDPELSLTAGTAWHYSREDTARLDYLFIDEAGQISLADALAMATAADNVVLLGDPQQLPHVSQATHPEGSSLSVLEHLLGDAQTVDPARGIFLEQTFRMHPEVCGFVSELMYEGRLRSAPGRERQRVEASGELAGAGLRWLPVEHEGRSQRSPEEAERIAAAVEQLLDGGTFTDEEGKSHPLTAADVLVVTPYNAQISCLRDLLPDEVRVGTVDKFQGQQAQVVFFSMATSSGDFVPRNVEFLFSRNRLNVAISRARCLAVLAFSPKLLDIHANSIEQMRLVNALCRFAEVAGAEGVSSAEAPPR